MSRISMELPSITLMARLFTFMGLAKLAGRSSSGYLNCTAIFASLSPSSNASPSNPAIVASSRGLQTIRQDLEK